MSSSWRNSLYTPTMIQKVGNEYFIVDCWHHRIIYNDNLRDNISDWKTLTEDINGGHTLAYDGEFYFCDDTDSSQIKIFSKAINDDGYIQIGNIQGVVGRPHFIEYDAFTKSTYVLSSEAAFILKLQKVGTNFEITRFNLSYLENIYARSFNIIGDFMYIVTSSGKIFQVEYRDNSYKAVDCWEVPEKFFGMNFLDKIDDYWYLTTYQNKREQIRPNFIRAEQLNDFAKNDYEDLYQLMDFQGVPYYITHFDNKHFVTEIDTCSGVKSFCTNGKFITDIETYYFFEGRSNESALRRQRLI